MGAEILSGKFPNSVSIAICLPLSFPQLGRRTCTGDPLQGEPQGQRRD